MITGSRQSIWHPALPHPVAAEQARDRIQASIRQQPMATGSATQLQRH
jgi:hypothetical protein